MSRLISRSVVREVRATRARCPHLPDDTGVELLEEIGHDKATSVVCSKVIRRKYHLQGPTGPSGGTVSGGIRMWRA